MIFTNIHISNCLKKKITECCFYCPETTDINWVENKTVNLSKLKIKFPNSKFKNDYI